jgi:hypothetical protein
VDVEEGYLADRVARGVLRDGGNIVDAKACAVVGLVDKAILDVLIVIHGADGALVYTGVFRVLEVADVLKMSAFSREGDVKCKFTQM